MAVDLGGKSLQPKGGYEKEAYGLTWTEHPHPHWHMNFMGGNTRLRNGTIVLIDRLALTIEGPAVTLENMTFEGVVATVSDSLPAAQSGTINSWSSTLWTRGTGAGTASRAGE